MKNFKELKQETLISVNGGGISDFIGTSNPVIRPPKINPPVINVNGPTCDYRKSTGMDSKVKLP